MLEKASDFKHERSSYLKLCFEDEDGGKKSNSQELVKYLLGPYDS